MENTPNLEIEVIKTYRGLSKESKVQIALEIIDAQKLCFKTKDDDYVDELERLLNLFNSGTVAVIKATYFGKNGTVLDKGFGTLHIDDYLISKGKRKQYWLNELCRATYVPPKHKKSPIEYVIKKAEEFVKNDYLKRKTVKVENKLNLLVETKPKYGSPQALLSLYSTKYGFINQGNVPKYPEDYYYMTKDLS